MVAACHYRRRMTGGLIAERRREHSLISLSELDRRHQLWYRTAVLMSALAIVCTTLSFIDTRTLLGVSVWSKPVKFSVSLAVYFATLAWFAPLLPAGYFQLLRGRLLTWLPVVCALFEIAYITFQASQAEASHFNYSTPFHSVMYSLMGGGAVVLVLACLAMGLEILRHQGLKDPYKLAVGLGLIASFVLGGGIGGYLAGQSGHWVGGSPTDAQGLALFNWSRDGGDLRVAHFFGMHAMQVLPLVGAAVTGLLSRGQAVIAVWSTLFVYSALTLWTFVTALMGQPFIS